MNENIRTGKLVREGEKYSVIEAGRRQAIPIDLVAGEPQLEKLVGTEVEILYATPRPSVVGLLWKKPFPPDPFPPDPPFPPCYFILCYYPPPDPLWRQQISEMMPVMNEAWRMDLANRLLKDGVISEEIHAKLTQY